MNTTRQLLNILQQQFDICSRYLDAQNKKTQSLIVGDIKILDNLVRDDQSFVMKMESLDKKRILLLDNMMIGDATISEIINHHVEDKYKQEYSKVFENLNYILGELKKINALNQRLLKQRLTVVNIILNDENTNYNNDSYSMEA
jgi:hypothetical protein